MGGIFYCVKTQSFEGGISTLIIASKECDATEDWLQHLNWKVVQLFLEKIHSESMFFNRNFFIQKRKSSKKHNILHNNV